MKLREMESEPILNSLSQARFESAGTSWALTVWLNNTGSA